MRYTHKRLPQLDGGLFLTDSGIETTLIFHYGLELPYFAAFPLLKDAEGRQTLRDYYAQHFSIPGQVRAGFILESPTWRANPNWARKLGYSAQDLADINRAAIDLMHELRREFETPSTPMVVSGCVGPADDGYRPGSIMSADEAEAYHSAQIGALASAGVNQVTAMTMTNVPEAIGIVRAAQAQTLPVVISFTVETDGRLPAGETLGEAIQAVDAATDAGPAYYVVNCAHPTHFDTALGQADWVRRIKGIRANASRCSHAELDEADTLDDGNPAELGQQYASLRSRYPWINVLGGCCGTDRRHIEHIATACAA